MRDDEIERIKDLILALLLATAMLGATALIAWALP